MEISQLCRSCMKELCLWEYEIIDDRRLEIFYYCTNIKITDDEKLPKQFCNECIVKLEASYSYITEAQKADVTLRNIISRSETSIIVEPETYIKNNENHTNLGFPQNSNKLSTEQVDSNNFENETNSQCDELHKADKACNIVNTQSSDPVISDPPESTNNIVSNSEQKKNVCPVCRKVFISKTWFNKHMAKEHEGKEHICNNCQKTFTKLSQLRCHMKSHSEERRFECSTCGKRFKCNKQVTAHARAHADARPYACDKCTMRFKKRSILKCHMKVHESEKQFLCSFCGWSFAQAGNLEVHIRRHTGEKPYACGTCGYRAAAASNLRRHQRAHQAPRRHACAACGKGLCDASSLARHVRTHTGERPYACWWCARGFADSWKRKLHAMRHHRLLLHQLPRRDSKGRLLNNDAVMGSLT